jgi:hypothetical protein
MLSERRRKMNLINENKPTNDLIEDLNLIDNLIFEASTTDDLVEIENLIGISTILPTIEWENLPSILKKLSSPFADTYQNIINKWIEIDPS